MTKIFSLSLLFSFLLISASVFRMNGDDDTPSSEEVVATVNNLIEARKFDKVLDYGESVLPLLTADSLHLTRFYLLDQMAVCQFYNGDYRKAVEIQERVVADREKLQGKENVDYFSSLCNLSTFYAELDMTDRALDCNLEGLRIMEKIDGKENNDYCTAMCNVARLYSTLGQYDKAIDTMLEEIALRESLEDCNRKEYGRDLANLANYYSYKGDVFKAMEYGEKALQISRETSGPDSPSFATTLANVASYYAGLGDYAKATPMAEESLRIREEALGENHPDLIQSLNNLASYYSATGNRRMSRDLNLRALQKVEALVGKKHTYYITLQHNLSDDYFHLGEYDKALASGEEVLQLSDVLYGEVHPKTAVFLANVAKIKGKSGRKEEALADMERGLRISAATLGLEHPRHIQLLQSMASLSESLNADSLTAEYTPLATSLVTPLIRNAFANLPGNRRHTYWDKHKNWYLSFINLVAATGKSPELIENGYDGALFSKGILLNSERQLADLIAESEDPEAMECYSRINAIYREIDSEGSSLSVSKSAKLDSLRDEVTLLENQLMKRSKVFGDFTRNLSIGWRDVLANLKSNELAVDFVMFRKDGKFHLSAYLLRKGWNTPRMINYGEIDKMPMRGRSIYSDPAFSRQLWGPVLQAAGDVADIYFAPVGELHNISIETLPDWKNPELYLSDKLNFHRVSSTRELALRGTMKEKERNAVLIGDVDFGTSDSLSGLPATRLEVENISKAMSHANYPYTLLMGKEADKEAFMALSGHAPSILHISTHGFYAGPGSEIEGEGEVKRGVADRLRKIESQSMTNSGINLAGGVATQANEIARLDFRGLDLVVLSACKSGLGEISADGVYGLQRGFKKAGAGTIVMSLWDVGDIPTSILMSAFYSNLMSGKTKWKSLKEAQKTVRNYTRHDPVAGEFHPYADPSYWAAFIILDAL